MGGELFLANQKDGYVIVPGILNNVDYSQEKERVIFSVVPKRFGELSFGDLETMVEKYPLQSILWDAYEMPHEDIGERIGDIKDYVKQVKQTFEDSGLKGPLNFW